jgi:transcriptional regulator with XRE-family HTH domain
LKIERLRLLREKRGLSQGEAAKRMGIVRTTYSNYEAGNREPDIETLNKMAKFYDVSIDYLLGNEVKKEESKPPESLSELEEVLMNNKFTLDGKPVPQKLIDDILAYVRIAQAKDK